MSVGKLNAIGSVSRDTPLAADKAETVQDKRVLEAARMYEKQFLREMVKAMRGTVSASDVTKPSMGEQIYRGQLDEEYVEAWGDQGGVGLADLIYDELMNKIMNLQGRANKPSGPIALTDRDLARVTRTPSSVERQAALRVELKPDEAGGPAKIQAPWDAKVLAKTRVDGKSTVLLEHDGGVRSAMIFDGVPTSVEPGQSLSRGTPIGILSPEIKSFFWNLSAKAESGPGAPGSPDPAIISASTKE